MNPASLGSVPTPNQSPNPLTDWAGTFPHGTVEMQGLLSIIVPWQYQFPEWKPKLLPTLWPHGDKQDIHKLPVTRKKLVQWVQTEVWEETPRREGDYTLPRLLTKLKLPCVQLTNSHDVPGVAVSGGNTRVLCRKLYPVQVTHKSHFCAVPNDWWPYWNFWDNLLPEEEI